MDNLDKSKSQSKPQKSLRSRALEMLSRREMSRLELQRKLMNYIDSENPEEMEQVESILNEFSERAWQSDERFTEMWVNSKSRKQGSIRLRQELSQKGVDSELISQFLPDEESELEHAIQVLTKKFKSQASDSNEKNKQIRFLAYRGFKMDIIQKALKSAWLESE